MTDDKKIQIIDGRVRYKNRDDYHVFYTIVGEKAYYFFGESVNAQLKNGNRIATTDLKEAIDPMVEASHVGVLDESGREVINFEYRAIRNINDDILLTILANPKTQSVIEAESLRKDALAASDLLNRSNTIKKNISEKMSPEGRFVFNNLFSEATVFDINGNNLVNGDTFSFIAHDGNKLLFSKNTMDSPITEYSMLTPEVQSNVSDVNASHDLDVQKVEVPEKVFDNAVAVENEKLAENIPQVEEEKVEEVKEEVAPVEETVPVEEVAPVEVAAPVAETTPVEAVSEAVEVKEEVKEPANEVVPENVEEEKEEVVEQKVEAPQEEKTDSNLAEEEVKLDIDGEKTELDELFNLNNDNTVNNNSEVEEVHNNDFSFDVDDNTHFEDIAVDKIENVYDEKPEYFSYEKGNASNIMLDVEDSLKGLLDQNGELKNKVNDLENKVEVLESSRNTLVVKNKKLEQTLKDKDAEIEYLESRLQELTDVNDSYRERIDTLRTEVEFVNSRKDDLKGLLEEAKKTLEVNDNYYDYRPRRESTRRSYRA